MTDATLVLVPGLLCDAASWSTIPDTFCKTMPVAVADITGQDSIPAMAAAVLDANPGTLLVAGHSLGGRVALEMWRLAPERIAGLALFDTGAAPAKETETAVRSRRVKLAYDQGMEALAADWVPPFVHPGRHADKPLMDMLTAMVLRRTPEIHERQIRALLTRPDATPLLPGITVPTLVLTGRQDDWAPPAAHEALAASIPGAALVIVEDSGHFTICERPDVVIRAMQEWVGKALA